MDLYLHNSSYDTKAIFNNIIVLYVAKYHLGKVKLERAG